MKTTYIPLFLILSSFIACQNEKNSLDEQIVPNHQETITSLSRSTQNNVLDSVYVNTEGALVFETATAYMSITDTLLQFTNQGIRSMGLHITMQRNKCTSVSNFLLCWNLTCLALRNKKCINSTTWSRKGWISFISFFYVSLR